MKNSRVVYFFLTASLIVSGCYYDNEEELYPGNICITENMSYTNNVLVILENNCYTCHDQTSNQGGVTLEGYANLKTYVDNGKLLGAIKHLPGFPQMPDGRPKLGQCQIDKIEAWINQGALNN